MNDRSDQTTKPPTYDRVWVISPSFTMGTQPERVADDDGEIATAVRRAIDASPTSEALIHMEVVKR